MKSGKGKITSLFIFIGLAILAVAEFILHREAIFMMDDNWYSTNWTFGNPLNSISDVLESQHWHFHNWGSFLLAFYTSPIICCSYGIPKNGNLFHKISRLCIME